MSTRKWIGIALLVILILALAGLATWNYTEPETFAYEINPVTLELRAVEYVDRPLTGRSSFRIADQKEMKIGAWLRDRGFLAAGSPGYWTLVKSYNERWGFTKGPGRGIQTGFDAAGWMTPMPHPSPESPNDKMVAWCNRYPDRATFVWKTYADLTKDGDSSGLWRAGEMLRWAVHFTNDLDDEQFVTTLRREVLYEP